MVKAISLTEANEMILGHKRLEKESLWKACQEIVDRLSTWRLGQMGNLSATTEAFCASGYLLHHGCSCSFKDCPASAHCPTCCG